MLDIPIQPEWIGKTILDLDLRKKYSINIVAICENDSVNININPQTVLTSSMHLIVIANPEKLEKLQS